MARVTVYRVELRAQSIFMARRVANRVLDEMQDAARINAATGQYSKGHLSASVYKTGPLVQGRTIHGTIGSRLSYAASVEKGARVHDIFPKGAPHVYRFGAKRRPMLKFVWHGHVVYMNQIPGGPGTVGRSHPGQKGKHWLSKATAEVGLRKGLRVIIYDV